MGHPPGYALLRRPDAMRPQGAVFRKQGALGSDSFRNERRVKSEHLLDIAVEARFVERVGKLLDAEIPFHLE
jgi:hypothetical protein